MLSRPWSKYSKGSSAYNRLHPEDKPSKKKLEKVVSEEEDLSDEAKKELVENKKKKGRNRIEYYIVAQELQEFLNVMKSRNTKKTWKNDEVTVPLHSDEESDSDEYQDIPEITKSSHFLPHGSNNEENDQSTSHEYNENYQAILRGTNEESDSDSESDDDEKRTIQPEVDIGDEDVIEEGRLFIRNLPYSCKEEEIAAHVKQFGDIVDVFIPLNAKRESKGYCFVTFMFPEQAIIASEVI